MIERERCCECGCEAKTYFPLSSFPMESEPYCWNCVAKARLRLLELIDEI